jgi:hypothetical protein
MSQSLRYLKFAVREFTNRPIEEDIDPEQLRDVLWELEGELEMLYEPREERAAMRAEVEAMLLQAVLQIRSSHEAKPSPPRFRASSRIGWRVRRPD